MSLVEVDGLKARWKVREMLDCKQEIELQVLLGKIKDVLTLEDVEGLTA